MACIFLGVVTNRDEWVYDFAPDVLAGKVSTLVNSYEETRVEHGGKEFDDIELETYIKWTRDLKRQLRKNSQNVFESDNIRTALFRPFITKALYFSQSLNEMQYRIPELFPRALMAENKVICLSGTSSSKPFQVLASNLVYSLDLLEKTQCLPLYRYNDDGERVGNITEWGLRRFRVHYGDDSISAEDIFAYTYAVLHDPRIPR